MMVYYQYGGNQNAGRINFTGTHIKYSLPVDTDNE